jgi:uncharacterized lipoprotein YddW (UPF0748 family)
MQNRRSGIGLLVGLALVLACTALAARPEDARQDEMRAMWVLRTSLTSPTAIDRLVKQAKENGFNTLFVQVRGRGDAFYRGGLEPISPDLQRQPQTFDPLTHTLKTARPAGIRVHAWININLVSSAVSLPSAREHLIYRHPQWLMVPRDIAQELARVPVDSPAYVGRLARWTRQQSADVEGLYATPIVPSAAAHAEAVVRDIASRYDVDGIHFDYARFPTDRFDHSRAAIAQFRTTIRPQLDDTRRRVLDAREAVDLFAYVDAFPAEWRTFRVERMTALMSRLRAAVKAERPEAVVSVAAAPDRPEALSRKLQDWGGWLAAGIVDAVAPMAYTQETARFAEQIAAARQAAGTRALWAGIGSYRLTPAQTVDNINTARRLGADGFVLFSYDSISNPRQAAADYLPAVSRGAFTDRRVTDAGSR